MSNEITDLYLEWEQALGSEAPDAALVASIEDKAREQGFDFITVNEAMVARGGWRADLHPRGKDGRFINVGLLIDLLDFDLGDGRRKDHRGEVTAIRPNRNSPGNPDIQVDVGGRRVWVKPNAVSAAEPAKGRIKKLDSPDIAMHHDDDGGLDVVARNVVDLGMELDSPEIAMFHTDEGGSDVVARNAAELWDEGDYDNRIEGFSALSETKQVTIKERMAVLRDVTDAHLAEMREAGTDSPTEKVLLDAEYQRRQAGFKSNAVKKNSKTEIKPGSDFGIPVVGNDTFLVDSDGMTYVPYVDDAGTEWPYPDPMGQAPSMTGDFPGTLMSPVPDGYGNKVSMYFVLDTDAEAWVVANPGIAVYSQESHDFYEGAKGSTKTDWTPGYISGDMRLSKGVNLDDPKLVVKRSDEVELGDRIFFEGDDLDPGTVLTVRRVHHLPIEPGAKDRDPVIEAVDDNDVFHTLTPLADQRVDIIDEPQVRYERDVASDVYHDSTRDMGTRVNAEHPEAKRMSAHTMTPESNIIDVDADGSLRVRTVSEVGQDDTTGAITLDFDDGSSLVTAPEYNYWTTNWNYGKDPMEGVERMSSYVKPEPGASTPVPSEGQTINALRDLGYSDPIAAPSGNAWMMTNPVTNYQTMFYKNKDRVVVYNDNWGSSTPVFDGTFDEFMSDPHIAGIDPSIGTDAIAAAVETLLARGKWNPDLHPRGRDGQFIDVLGLVKLFDFDLNGERVSEGRGKVLNIVPDRKDRGNPDIVIELPNRQKITVKPSQVGNGPKVKAKLKRRERKGKEIKRLEEVSMFNNNTGRGIQHSDKVNAQRWRLAELKDAQARGFYGELNSPEFQDALREWVHSGHGRWVDAPSVASEKYGALQPDIEMPVAIQPVDVTPENPLGFALADPESVALVPRFETNRKNLVDANKADLTRAFPEHDRAESLRRRIDPGNNALTDALDAQRNYYDRVLDQVVDLPTAFKTDGVDGDLRSDRAYGGEYLDSGAAFLRAEALLRMGFEDVEVRDSYGTYKASFDVYGIGVPEDLPMYSPDGRSLVRLDGETVELAVPPENRSWGHGTTLEHTSKDQALDRILAFPEIDHNPEAVEMTDAEYDARAEMLELNANPLLRSQRADQLSEGDTFIDSDGEIAVVETIDDSTPDDGFVTVITTQGKVRALKPDDEVGMDAGNVPPSKKASDLRTGDNFIDHKGDLVTVGEFDDKDFDDTSITVITTGEKIRELKPNDEVGMNALPDSDDAPTPVAPKIDYSPEAMQARDDRMGDPAEQARRLEGLGITPGSEYGTFNPTGKPYKDIPAEDLGSKENPIRTNDPMVAVQALHDGKHVELQQIDQVSTMLDELGRIANEAREKGVDAGDYDLCKVTVPDTNLFCIESKGIPRIKMPQLSGIPTPGSRADRLPKTDKGEVDIGPAFVTHLEAKGISVTETRLPASHLRASQNELVGAKVSDMMGAMQSGNPKAIQNIRESAIFTTADNYVVDGHHRWAAVVGLDLSDGVLSGDVDMPVRQIDMEILDVLNEAYAFAIDFGIPPKAGSGVEGAQEEAAATVASLRSRVHSGGSNQ